MADLKSIRVVTYDGYRNQERPVEVELSGERFVVKEIEDSWIAAGVDPADEVTRGFVVRCVGGARFRIVHSEEKANDPSDRPAPSPSIGRESRVR